MKTRNKALLLTFGAVLLVAASVLGTLAYLTATDKVVNTFTVGSVKITLDEAKVDADGKVVEGEGAGRVKVNSYKLMPGHTYAKDPTVTVKARSENSYVRMLVTISNASALKEVFGENFLPENYVEGWDSATWVSAKEVKGDDTADTVTYEFRYKGTVAAPTADVVLDDLFETFTVPGIVTNEQLAKLEGLEITVVAHAIQADGFENADAAWEAFDEQQN